jgi:hypothetical protein
MGDISKLARYFSLSIVIIFVVPSSFSGLIPLLKLPGVGKKYHFFNFEGPLRPSGLGYGHLGGTVKLAWDSSFEICNNMGVLLLKFSKLFLFKVTWGRY